MRSLLDSMSGRIRYSVSAQREGVLLKSTISYPTTNSTNNTHGLIKIIFQYIHCRSALSPPPAQSLTHWLFVIVKLSAALYQFASDVSRWKSQMGKREEGWWIKNLSMFTFPRKKELVEFIATFTATFLCSLFRPSSLCCCEQVGVMERHERELYSANTEQRKVSESFFVFRDGSHYLSGAQFLSRPDTDTYAGRRAKPFSTTFAWLKLNVFSSRQQIEIERGGQNEDEHASCLMRF